MLDAKPAELKQLGQVENLAGRCVAADVDALPKNALQAADIAVAVPVSIESQPEQSGRDDAGSLASTGAATA